MTDEYIDLGPAVTNWGGFEVLDSRAHCQLSRRVRDGALFAEIWVPQASDCAEQTWAYIGPVRLPQ